MKALIAGFPVVLVMLGLVVVALAIRVFVTSRKRRRDPAAGRALVSPLSGRVGGTLVGLIFALSGLLILNTNTIRPGYRASLAATWPTADGRVTSSRIAAYQDTDGPERYRPDIHYRYAVRGRSFENNARDSGGVGRWSVDRWAQWVVVSANPPGTPVTVHYDPVDPADAMLSVEPPRGTYSMAWFPLLFFVIGSGIVVAALLGQWPDGTTPRRPAGATPSTPAPIAVDARRSRRRTFFGLLAFAVFWNGILIGMAYGTHFSYFLIPFAVIGVLIAIGVVFAGLALFNPVVSVTFARMPIRPGERTDVTFAVGGNYTAIRSLSFDLEGRERVSYRQGTDTRTETHIAWSIPLFESTRVTDFERGHFRIDLPPDAMPTFVAPNNRLTWHLRCRGEIPHRPKIKDEFDVTVAFAGETA